MLTTYRRLFGLLDARERRRFVVVLAMILIMGLVDALGIASIFPFLAVLSTPEIIHDNAYLAAIYDGFGFNSQTRFLVFLGAFILAFILLGQAFKAFTVYAMTRFGMMREFTIGSRLLTGYLRQPYVWFLNRNSADLGRTVLAEVAQVTNQALMPALRLLAQSVVILFIVALLLIVNPLAAAGSAILVGGAYGLVFLATRRRLTRFGQDRIDANTRRYRITQEVIGGIKDVKLLGLEQSYLERFREAASLFASRQASAIIMAELPRFLLEGIIFGGMILLVIVLIATSDGSLVEILPVLGVFAFAGARLFPALQQVYGAIANLRSSGPILEVLDVDLQQTEAGVSVQAAESAGRAPSKMAIISGVELDRVSYTYPGAERSALLDLSLKIGVNATVAIVGPTGAGKTTALDLILGLLEPDKGNLKVDGAVIDNSNLRSWQRSLGYVPQQIFLTDDTVAANIALGVAPQQIDMHAVERAAHVANLHGFVTGSLRKGFDTEVGERGVRLSGGQRQRIGIARALYHDPMVLVLDEATSALDNLTELAVMDAVHNLIHTKTIIIVAHRLSTVRDCDKIFLIDKGTCVASGGYEDLLDRSSEFREIAAAGR